MPTGQTMTKSGRGKKATAHGYAGRSCPCCSGSGTGPAAIFTAPPAEHVPFPELVRQWNLGIFVSKSFFSYHRCPSCGLLYASVYPSDRQLAELYGSMPPNMSELPESSLRRTQYGYARRLLKHGPPDGDYVEIGPDTGLLAGMMRAAGRFPRFWFIEPNSAVHEELRNSVRPSATVLSTDLNDYRAIPDGTAAAAMVHVLDHLTDPRHHLRELHRVLKVGGLLSIVVHNERSLLSRCFGARHPIYCPYHPQLFNPASLARIVESAGFKVLDVARTVNHYPAMYLLKHALFRGGLGFYRLPALPWLCFPVPLGNIQLTARRVRTSGV